MSANRAADGHILPDGRIGDCHIADPGISVAGGIDAHVPPRIRGGLRVAAASGENERREKRATATQGDDPRLPATRLIDAISFLSIAIPFIVGSGPSRPTDDRWIGRGRQCPVVIQRVRRQGATAPPPGNWTRRNLAKAERIVERNHGCGGGSAGLLACDPDHPIRCLAPCAIQVHDLQAISERTGHALEGGALVLIGIALER